MASGVAVDVGAAGTVTLRWKGGIQEEEEVIGPSAPCASHLNRPERAWGSGKHRTGVWEPLRLRFNDPSHHFLPWKRWTIYMYSP